jgi:UDP-glucose 4-epimerase
MKILVTGGAGFIGSHVVDTYLEAGHEVVVVDNLATGQREHLNLNARLYELDIGSPKLAEVFEAEQPQIVNHHAAQAAVPRSVEDPQFDARVNVLGTLNLLQCCVRYGVQKVIYASTGGALYGEPERIPVPEEHPIRPVSPYGVSKYAGELYLQCFWAVHGLPYVILRYANVYGPRQDPYGEAGVVAIFTQRMLSGEQPVIYGDGTQTRDFVYVGDVARANLLALDAEEVVVHIGTGEETTVNELYEQLARLAGFQGPAKYGPPRPGDVYRIALDVRKAKELLGWEARTSLKEGLAKTVEAFRRGKGR